MSNRKKCIFCGSEIIYGFTAPHIIWDYVGFIKERDDICLICFLKECEEAGVYCENEIETFKIKE